MNTEGNADQSLWWIVKPAEPSSMSLMLHRLRLRGIPHQQSERGSVMQSEIDTVEDERLRTALGRQAASVTERSILIPVANHDGSYSHSFSVPRGSMFGRTDTHENN
ncbi:MAG: hypothetical protein ABIQ64_04480 [Candidatus Saccharimonadales bacterium]